MIVRRSAVAISSPLISLILPRIATWAAFGFGAHAVYKLKFYDDMQLQFHVWGESERVEGGGGDSTGIATEYWAAYILRST